MQPFEYANAATLTEAYELLGDEGAVAKAGGIDLIDLMKEGLAAPKRLVHLRPIGGLNGVTDTVKTGLRLGPLATLAEIADHPMLNKKYAAIAQAAGGAATPQIRNAATLGGNLCQRPRCWYFRSADFHCLRKGGDRCFAQDGEHKYHAVFDNGLCAIVHPSALAVALTAFRAKVLIGNSEGVRTVPIDEFFLKPEADVMRENILKAGELIVEVIVPPAAGIRRSAYLKLKEKQTFDWPIGEAGVVLEMDGNICKAASVVMGAAAPVPWRVPAAEALLAGKEITPGLAAEAAAEAIREATPLRENAYKIQILQATVRRAVLTAAGIDPLG